MSADELPSLAEVTAALTAPGAMFEMEDVVVDGVALRAWKNAPPTLRELLDLSRVHGEAEFLVYDAEAPGAVPGPFDRVTFLAHAAASATFARRLIEDHGVRPGDRVAIAMRNFPEWSIAFWGAAAAGAVVVPLNAWWTGPELAYGLADSGSKVAIADLERAERIGEHRAELPDLEAVIVARAGGDTIPGTIAFEDVIGDRRVRHPAARCRPRTRGRRHDLLHVGHDGTAQGRAGHPPQHLHEPHQPRLLRGPRSDAFDRRPGRPRSAPGERNVYLLSVPFFHATGCHSVLVANLAVGGEIVIMHKWDAERALELIERERVTIFGGVPAMVWQVLEHPDFERYDLSSVKSIGYGGAPAAPELVRRLEAMFPGRTPSQRLRADRDVVGDDDELRTSTTSASPTASACRSRCATCRSSTPTDGVLPTGEVGELWIKGPNVVKGYWNKPEATAAAFTDGWLHSGDVARVDDEGFVFIVDRAKDMIIRGGENVYCVEVEAALFEHPAVTDAAVIGIPHHVLGEEVGAVVHLAPGTSGDRGRAACVRRRPDRRLQGAGADLVQGGTAPPQPERQDHEARPEGRAPAPLADRRVRPWN